MFKPLEVLPATLRLGDEEYPVKFSNRALMLAEDKSGMPMTVLLTKLLSFSVSTEELCALVYGALKEGGDTELSYKDVVDGIPPVYIPDILQQIADIIVQQVPMKHEKKTDTEKVKR